MAYVMDYLFIGFLVAWCLDPGNSDSNREKNRRWLVAVWPLALIILVCGWMAGE